MGRGLLEGDAEAATCVFEILLHTMIEIPSGGVATGCDELERLPQTVFGHLLFCLAQTTELPCQYSKCL